MNIPFTITQFRLLTIFPATALCFMFGILLFESNNPFFLIGFVPSGLYAIINTILLISDIMEKMEFKK